MSNIFKSVSAIGLNVEDSSVKSDDFNENGKNGMSEDEGDDISHSNKEFEKEMLNEVRII
jgi:hypothetical protein